MWIGSSIGLGYDTATLPNINTDEKDIKVIVKLFDFGRSVIDDASSWKTLTD